MKHILKHQKLSDINNHIQFVRKIYEIKCSLRMCVQLKTQKQKNSRKPVNEKKWDSQEFTEKSDKQMKKTNTESIYDHNEDTKTKQ